MSELIKIEKPEDLSNLVGWSIIKSWKSQEQTAPVINMVLSSPTAEAKVHLRIWPGLNFGRCGNLPTVNETLKAKADDLTDEQAKNLLS